MVFGRVVFTCAFVAGITAGAAVAQVDPGHYQDFGDAGGFRNILPPGADGSLNGAEAIQAQLGTYPPYVTDQLTMYGELVYATPGLTDDRIPEFFGRVVRRPRQMSAASTRPPPA